MRALLLSYKPVVALLVRLQSHPTVYLQSQNQDIRTCLQNQQTVAT